MAKYGYHDIVKMARLNGQFAGTEARRKRRLEKEPDGFFLEVSDSAYTCSICDQHKYGQDMWWDAHGQRCNDCRRNMLTGVIPIDLPTTYKQEVWFKEWHVSDRHDVHPATRGKLERQGILVGRKLLREDGTSYCTLYFYSENEEFLEKYPGKPKKPVIVKDSEGNEITL